MEQIEEVVTVTFKYSKDENIHDHVMWMESRDFRRVGTDRGNENVIIKYRKDFNRGS